ncbi:MAG: radical SAM protein, partial [bacterium]
MPPALPSLLFIQLPQLDNEVVESHENLPLAAMYLTEAATRAGETRWYRPLRLTAAEEHLDNRHLTERLLARQPAVIAATLYLWNIERTLRVLHAVRRQAPKVKIVVGGPEVARPHPFLFRDGVPDAAVAGEGEAVFPMILRAFRGAGRQTDFTTVAWRRRDGRYVWGHTSPPPVELSKTLPPPSSKVWRPDANGMAYLETSRGCPLTCAYCRYHHLHAGMSVLPVDAVIAYVRILHARGAREIRFIDPMFNAHPRFTALLQALSTFNAGGAITFFAEVLADRITKQQAGLLKRAHFTEVEVGLQSRRRAVLRAVRRSGTPQRVENGMRLLTDQGLRVTLDLMYALPRQRRRDVLSDLRWAAPQRRVNVQC